MKGPAARKQKSQKCTAREENNRSPVNSSGKVLSRYYANLDRAHRRRVMLQQRAEGGGEGGPKDAIERRFRVQASWHVQVVHVSPIRPADGCDGFTYVI